MDEEAQHTPERVPSPVVPHHPIAHLPLEEPENSVELTGAEHWLGTEPSLATL